ncbi:MAG: cyclic nucleotide-binding domain-containing protein [Candidatus Zixiibacteriota bacterium]
MENLERILRDHPIVAGLSPEHVSLLVGCASNVVFKAGEFIFREGDDADSFYVIRQGKVVLETYVPHMGPKAIQTRVAGEVTGWSWMIEPYRWHFDARALELTKAIALDGKCLREKCEKDHDLGYALIKKFFGIIAQRLEATQLQLMDIYRTNSHD